MMAIILKGYSAWRRNMEQRIISSVLGLLIFAQHISGDDLGKCEILSPRKKKNINSLPKNNQEKYGNEPQ